MAFEEAREIMNAGKAESDGDFAHGKRGVAQFAGNGCGTHAVEKRLRGFLHFRCKMLDKGLSPHFHERGHLVYRQISVRMVSNGIQDIGKSPIALQKMLGRRVDWQNPLRQETIQHSLQQKGTGEGGILFQKALEIAPFFRCMAGEGMSHVGKELHAGEEFCVEMNGKELQSFFLVMVYALEGGDEEPGAGL